MQVQIFNVAHGFCAYVVADTQNVILIDCGHNNRTGFYPSDYLLAQGCTGIERLFILNYDEDHLSGLPRLLEESHRVPIRILNRNPTVSADQLRELKSQGGPLGAGMKALLGLIRTYTYDVAVPPDYGELTCSTYCNSYPQFTDTNNLSLVLFLHYKGISIVFPGDLEKAGWTTLLKNPTFCDNLRNVNIFVASHHGRESGYAKEIFNYCTPSVVVISDEAINYETQEDSYAQHARGITWNSTDRRKVLTTRNDGMLTITPNGGDFYIRAGG